MNFKIWPYRMGSSSAKLLAEALGCKRVASDSTTFRPRIRNLIINWGNGGLPVWWNRLPVYNIGGPVLNIPGDVVTAANKFLAFNTLTANEVRTVPWTIDHDIALTWKGECDLFLRHKLTGHSGEGIEIFRQEEADSILPRAPLYTKRIRGKYEYRVHVAGGEVIHVQQKRRRADFDGNRVDGIRNLANGYVFACNDIVQPHPDVLVQAVNAVAALGLDFGAVDVIQYKDEGWVLEINTAPGLEGTTLEKYVEYFRSLLNG